MHPSWYRTVKSAAIQHLGRDRKRRQELIAHEKIAVDKKNLDEVEKKARDAARKAEMLNLTPYLDTAWIQANHTGIKGTGVEKQINWHRQFVEKEVISGYTVSRTGGRQHALQASRSSPTYLSLERPEPGSSNARLQGGQGGGAAAE
ncbi:hypothetical protein B0H11DRAFT_1917624 [Mycena galericulata]|nr:hypothetical protein B0H11DRAFT_1917624 [Mycena galericulata]